MYYKITRYNEVIENFIHASQTYVRVDKDHNSVETNSCDMTWRIHEIEECISILNSIGYQVVELVGDYNTKRIDESMFIQIIAKRGENMEEKKNIQIKELKPELTQCRIIQMEKERKEKELKEKMSEEKEGQSENETKV